MPLENDRLLPDLQALARGLRREADEMQSYMDELRVSIRELEGGTVTPLHREPTATLEVTEDELQAGIKRLVGPEHDEETTREELSLRNKLVQALALESGPGGSFDTGDTAA